MDEHDEHAERFNRHPNSNTDSHLYKLHIYEPQKGSDKLIPARRRFDQNHILFHLLSNAAQFRHITLQSLDRI
jgi:hypothetical protein